MTQQQDGGPVVPVKDEKISPGEAGGGWPISTENADPTKLAAADSAQPSRPDVAGGYSHHAT